MIPMDGRQPSCMQQWVEDAACVQKHAMAVSCMQQCAAAAACVRQWAGAASSTIAMEDSDGNGQPAAQLQWAAAAAVQRMAGWRQDRN
jgi:hypothetical protein